MATAVIAFRHPEKVGEAEFFSPDDVGITEEGKRQAESLIEQIHELKIGTVFCSKMARSIQLGIEIQRKIGVHVVSMELFNEWKAPTVRQGGLRSDPELQEMSRLIRENFAAESTRQYHDEETRPMVEERTRQIFSLFTQHPDDVVGLVGHAKLLCGMHEWVMHGDLSHYYQVPGPDTRLEIEPASMSVFVRKPDRRTGIPEWTIRLWNYVPHSSPLRGLL